LRYLSRLVKPFAEGKEYNILSLEKRKTNHLLSVKSIIFSFWKREVKTKGLSESIKIILLNQKFLKLRVLLIDCF